MAMPPISASINSNSWLCSLAMTSRTRRASRSTSGPTPSPGSHAMTAFMNSNQILIFDSLFPVGYLEELDIRLLELIARQREAEFAITRLEGMTAGVFAKHNHAARNPDAVRRHDFVRHRVLQHAVLMDAGFV